MKTNLLILVFVMLSCKLFSQCPTNPWSGPLPFHLTDFELPNSHVHFNIDTSMPNNCWQLGNVSKSGFLPALSPIHAIQTDTLNSYPSNNESSIEFWNDSSFNFAGSTFLSSISFRHHYQVDSLTDSLLVQLTLDSGHHWLNPAEFYSQLQSMMGFAPMMSYEGIRMDNLHPSISNKILFTGSDTGWTQVNICFTFFAISPSRQLDSSAFGVRFLLKSDSIQLNHPGWEIDDIKFLQPSMLSGVNDISASQIHIYPNPSLTGEYHFEIPNQVPISQIELFDAVGRKLKTISNSTIISLSEYPSACYFYRIMLKDHEQVFEGKLLKD